MATDARTTAVGVEVLAAPAASEVRVTSALAEVLSAIEPYQETLTESVTTTGALGLLLGSAVPDSTTFTETVGVAGAVASADTVNVTETVPSTAWQAAVALELLSLAETAPTVAWSLAVVLSQPMTLTESELRLGLLYDTVLSQSMVVTDPTSRADLRTALAEALGITAVQAGQATWYVTLAQIAHLLEAVPVVGAARSVTENLSVTSVDAAQNVYAPVVTDSTTVTPTQARWWSLRPTITQPTTLTDTARSGLGLRLTASATMSATLTAIRAIAVIEALGLGATLTSALRYGRTSSDTVTLGAALAQFFGATAADTLSVTATLTPAAQMVRAVTDTATLSATASIGKMVLRLDVDDTLTVTPAMALRWLFRPVATDDVVMAVTFVTPSGGVVTWAMNTGTAAVTEYTNFAYNSFAPWQATMLAASDTGLYTLLGATDHGTDIIAQIRSGFLQFAGSHYTSFKAAYLGMHATGTMFVKLITGDAKTYTYQVVVQDMQTTKVRLGKGLRARYFAFELTSTGQDFDLDTVEFVPLLAQRRV